MDVKNNAHSREGRSRASRLTVDLSQEIMTALKTRVAARRATIWEVVTDFVQKEIKEEHA